jgi:hypothetical protein
MEAWGWNPATVEAIAAATTTLGVFLAWLALRESRAQRAAFESEMASRLRPWVGLYGFEFKADTGSNDRGSIGIVVRNFGPLPAQRAKLCLTLRPVQTVGSEPDNPVRRDEAGLKALLPGEDGNYTIDLSQYPQFTAWRLDRRDVQVEGHFSYALDERQFRTEFEGIIWFSGSQVALDGKLKINWRNRDAT